MEGIFKIFNFLLMFSVILALILMFVGEIESQRVPPLRAARQEENVPEPEVENGGRQIRAKRQNYNSADGVLGLQFPFNITIGNANSNADMFRPSITQEDHITFTAPQKIKARGFYFEEHIVETEDGYLLTLFRLWNPNCTDGLDKTKAPIFFMHGVLDSADTWFVLEAENGARNKAQAASYRYDVWIGNARGNHYSNKHKTLSQKDPEYWNFSWHEMGTKDLPAVFRHILEKTQKTNPRQKINYVGHSMGTTMFYVCMSTFPELNKIIDVFIALPPSAFLTSITSPLAVLKPYSKLYNSVLIDGPFLISEINHLISKTLVPLCPFNFSIGQIEEESICNFLVYLGQGVSKEDTNATLLQRVFGHFPSTTSKKLIAHFVQLVGEDRFTQFDYDSPVKNYKKYGQTFPPSYNLYNVDVASVNYYGQRDILIDHRDSEENLRQLGTTRDKFNVLIMDYSHLDFIWGNTAAPCITSRFLKALTNFYQAQQENQEPPPPYRLRSGFEKNYGPKLTKDTSCTCACFGESCYEGVVPKSGNEGNQNLLREYDDSDYPFY